MSEVRNGQAAPQAAAENVLDALIEVDCSCGEHVSVTRSGADRLWECHNCRRAFLLFVQTGPSGVTLAVPLFVDTPATGEKPALPEPPEEMMLLCTCGSALRITRKLYNHRIQCPHCAARMALLLKFDGTQAKYVLDARRIEDQKAGDTHVVAPLQV